VDPSLPQEDPPDRQSGASAILTQAGHDSSFDSHLVRIGLDGAGRRWSIAPGQRGLRGPGWTVLDLASLVDTQEVAGSIPGRPTEVPRPCRSSDPPV